MALDRRRDAATASVGASAVAGGGVLRHRGVERSVPNPGMGQKVYPRIHLRAVAYQGDRRAKALYAGGSLLGLAGAAPLAIGASNLAHRGGRRVTSAKRDKSFLREGLEGSQEALQQRGGSTFQRDVPAKVRAVQAGGAAAAGWAGSAAASRALKNARGGRLKPALVPIAGVLTAASTVPLSNRAVRRVDSGYEVTAAGVKRAKTAPKRPSSVASVVDARAGRGRGNIRAQIVPSDLIRKREATYAQQRGIVTAAGATPGIGPITGGIAAARYAPPGQERKHAARQALIGPAAGWTAGATGAYGGAALAARNKNAQKAAEGIVGLSNNASTWGRKKLGLGPVKPLEDRRVIGRAIGQVRRAKIAQPLVGSKARLAGAGAGLLGAKAIGGFAGGQTSISLNQRDSRRWKQGVHKLDDGSYRQQHKAAKQKKVNAAVSAFTGAGAIGSAGLLLGGKKDLAFKTGIGLGAVGGANSLLYGRVARREARIADPYDKLSKREVVRGKKTANFEQDAHFAHELRAAGLRMRPQPKVTVKPLRTSKTLARVKAMDVEQREAYFQTKRGRGWMQRNGLGRAGTLSWGPVDAKTNQAWRGRQGFGLERKQPSKGYRGTGRAYAGVGKALIPPTVLAGGTMRGERNQRATLKHLRATSRARAGLPVSPIRARALTGTGTRQPVLKGLPRLPWDGPSHVIHRGVRARVLEYHGDGKMTVLGRGDQRHLVHRDQVVFPKPKKSKGGPVQGELFGKRESLAITGSRGERKKLIGQYGDRGPLPAGLDRNTKMKAYEARYAHHGGDSSEKWSRRANAAEGARNAALATGTVALSTMAALKHKKLAHLPARHPKVLGRWDAVALGSGAVGGGAELYGELARKRRASYTSSPGGVAASALRRMRANTPEAS